MPGSRRFSSVASRCAEIGSEGGSVVFETGCNLMQEWCTLTCNGKHHLPTPCKPVKMGADDK
jgi:hypothetical protein